MSKKFAGVIKTLNLGFLGEEWKECQLRFKALAVADLKDLTDLADLGVAIDKEGKPVAKNIEEASKGMEKVIKLLKDRFVDGTGLSEKGEVTKVMADDLEQFPAEVIEKAILCLTGGELTKKG